MTLARISEDELVSKLRAIVDATRTTRVRLGIGDDAAMWQPSRSHRSAITTDALVEGVHFTRETMAPAEIGWRTAVASLSDLAAMGARPVLATIALGVSPQSGVEELLEIYRGIAQCAAAACLAIVGGDVTRSPVLSLTMTAVGEVRPAHAKTRSGGRSGNVVAVTGDLCAARAGLDVARGAVSLGDAELERGALLAFRRPSARVREGRWLAASASVRAMMDCSDGLSTDLARLCEASGVGAHLDAVPIAPSALAAARALNEDALAYALCGGEEYELIVAIERRAFSHLASRFAARFGRRLHGIGALRAQRGVVLSRDGGEVPVPRTGWDHFKG